uniref:Amino acid transporter transmembrane domain-containing protein n=1 Tax=Ditylum brightwellii TaxID=49249 RepID=A0A7S4VVZ7_9STRA|mmetsp:Transcript_14148/g.19824  ORF Transcript_14148/g.19824 Transcript_14148/m.19824 type:complete len:467 (-) Transcript_14148:671-2071(-)
MGTQNEGVVDLPADIERSASGEFYDGNAIAERSGGQASIFSSIVNVANTTVGAGLLVQPYGFSFTGWALGMVIITFVYITSICTNLMIADVAAVITEEELTYQIMADQALPRFSYIVDSAAIIVGFGIGCSYTIVATDMMSMITGTDRWIWTISFTLCTAPMCFLRNIDSLRFTSTVSVGCLLFLSAVTVAYASSSGQTGTGGTLDACAGFEGERSCTGDVSIGTNSFFMMMNGIVFFVQGLVCHFTSPYIIRELEKPTRQRVAMVYAGGSGLAYCLYSIVGVSGYWTFGDSVEGNILNNYPRNALTTTMRVLVSFVVLFGYPMSCFSSRSSIEGLVSKFKCTKKTQQRSKEKRLVRGVGGDSSWIGYLSRNTLFLDSIKAPITYAWLFLTMLVGLFVMDIAITLGLAGTFGTAFLFYIAPGVMHLRLIKKSSHCLSLGIWASITFGVIIFTFGILFLVNPVYLHT